MWPPWSRGESKLLYDQSSWHAHYIVIGHTRQVVSDVVTMVAIGVSYVPPLILTIVHVDHYE